MVPAAFALGIVTPWGGAVAPLQEQRGRAAGAHGGPCNIARLHRYVRERPKEEKGTEYNGYSRYREPESDSA